jgi:hypothetical protein
MASHCIMRQFIFRNQINELEGGKLDVLKANCFMFTLENM